MSAKVEKKKKSSTVEKKKKSSEVEKKKLSSKVGKKKKAALEADPNDPKGLRITITNSDLKEAKDDLTGKVSRELKDVIAKLKAYHKEPSTEARSDLFGSCCVWYIARKLTEFLQDDQSDGVFRKLAVQAGCDAARCSDPPCVQFQKFVPSRAKTKTRIDPKVICKSRTVFQTLKEYKTQEQIKIAVLVIDLYGTKMAKQGLDKTLIPGDDITTNADNIKKFLTQTAGLPVYICSKKRKGDEEGEWICSDLGKELIKPFADEIPDEAETKYIYSHTSSVLVGTFKDTEDTLLDDLKSEGITDVFVTGFDANACVAATIFGSRIRSDDTREHPGLCDHGFNVITSIRVVGAGPKGLLNTIDGWPYMGECTKGN